jgi:hypothetical protein
MPVVRAGGETAIRRRRSAGRGSEHQGPKKRASISPPLHMDEVTSESRDGPFCGTWPALSVRAEFSIVGTCA